MEIPRTQRVLELLKANPKGISVDELCKRFNKEPKDILNSYQLLKKYNNIINDDGTIKLIEAGKGKPKNRYIRYLDIELYKQIIDLIKTSPNGISCSELATACNTNKKTISNKIFLLKQKGYKIEARNRKYWYISGPDNDGEQETKPVKIVPQSAGVKVRKENFDSPKFTNLIPKNLHPTFLNLSESDKIDCMDMLRKCLYYHKSALALLESSECVKSFVSSIERGF